MLPTLWGKLTASTLIILCHAPQHEFGESPFRIRMHQIELFASWTQLRHSRRSFAATHTGYHFAFLCSIDASRTIKRHPSNVCCLQAGAGRKLAT